MIRCLAVPGVSGGCFPELGRTLTGSAFLAPKSDIAGFLALLMSERYRAA